MKKWFTLVTFILVFSIAPIFGQGSIKVASFNLCIFGQAKSQKEDVMQILASIIREFDVVAVQEIRDREETAVGKLLNIVNNGPEQYGVVVGPRIGRTSSKEQYAYFYRQRTLATELEPITWNDTSDVFEREPFLAKFRSTEGNLDFVLANIHTKPTDATVEIGYLPGVMTFASEYFNEKDVICLGDYNADGDYFDEDSFTTVFPKQDYIWIIPNDADTNVAAKSMTYDRITATSSMKEDYLLEWGVMTFESIIPGTPPNLKPAEISDHYPVWAEFSISNDTD